MVFPNTRQIVVMGVPLINLSAMQAMKQANTEPQVCVTMFGHSGHERQDLVFILKVLIWVWGAVTCSGEKKKTPQKAKKTPRELGYT